MKYYNIGSGLAYQIYLVFQHIEKEHIYDFLSHHLPHSQSLQSNLAFPANPPLREFNPTILF